MTAATLPDAADLAGWRRLMASATDPGTRRALVVDWAHALGASLIDEFGELPVWQLPPDVDPDAAGAIRYYALVTGVPLRVPLPPE